MNFKDAYKSYNDEIKGDPKVLEAILSGKKKATEKSKKLFVIRPSFVGAMAAMVVIAVSIFGFNSPFNKTQSPQKNYIAARQAPQENNIPGAEFKAGNNQAQDTEAAKNNKALPKADVHLPYKADNSPVQVQPAQQDPDIYGVAAATQMPLSARTVPSDGDAVPDSADTVTTEDCYLYFGFNVTEKAFLPSDMEFGGNVIINSKNSLQTGEMEYCSFSIDAYSEDNPQRMLDICVEKQAAPMDNAGSEEYFTSDGESAAGGGKIVKENMSVTVNSQNVTKAEIGQILESLTK